MYLTSFLHSATSMGSFKTWAIASLLAPTALAASIPNVVRSVLDPKVSLSFKEVSTPLPFP